MSRGTSTITSRFFPIRTRGLVEELGLGDDYRWVETKTGFYTDGQLVSMSNTMEFLKFPPLGIIGKLRLGATIFIASRITDWKKTGKISVEDWLVRLSGRSTFERSGSRCSKQNLATPTSRRRRHLSGRPSSGCTPRKSGLKKEMFGYVRGGYARVLERFGKVLAREGVEIRLNSPVQTIEKLANGKLKVILRQSRRRNDPKPPQRTKYAPVRTAMAVMRFLGRLSR